VCEPVKSKGITCSKDQRLIGYSRDYLYRLELLVSISWAYLFSFFEGTQRY